MQPHKKILDIANRQASFQTIAKRVELLNEGFRALYADYSHHIEVTNGKDHEILKLKNNIDYRLFSSQFHLELILRQHYTIEDRIEEIYKKNPENILNPVYPSHPLYDICEQEVASIFDSIIFHLASVYDYLSAIINFICNKKDKSITKWSQLAKSCRGTGNKYNQLKISEVILKENDEFVDKLYRYRSRVIHERSEISPISLTLRRDSGKTNAKFFTLDSFTKNFKVLKEKSNDYNLTISYASDWLIHTTINSIISILFALKEEMERVSTFPDHIKGDDFILLYKNPDTGVAEPASVIMWENIKNNM